MFRQLVNTALKMMQPSIPTVHDGNFLSGNGQILSRLNFLMGCSAAVKTIKFSALALSSWTLLQIEIHL